MPENPRSEDGIPDVVPSEEVAAAGASDEDRAILESQVLEGEIVPDSKAFKENAWLENALAGHTVQAAALRNKMVEAYIANMDADRGMRQTYAGRILRYLEWYSGGVGVLLLLDGFGKAAGFDLDKEVVATLVGSTAVAAIGLVGFIARGLFRSPPNPPAVEKNE